MIYWKIEYDQEVLKELRKLDKQAVRRIDDYLNQRLTGLEDPRSLGKPLQGSKYESLWRFRVGDYRIIANIEDQVLTVTVVKIGHRKDVYR